MRRVQGKRDLEVITALTYTYPKLTNTKLRQIYWKAKRGKRRLNGSELDAVLNNAPEPLQVEVVRSDEEVVHVRVSVDAGRVLRLYQHHW